MCLIFRFLWPQAWGPVGLVIPPKDSGRSLQQEVGAGSGCRGFPQHQQACSLTTMAPFVRGPQSPLEMDSFSENVPRFSAATCHLTHSRGWLSGTHTPTYWPATHEPWEGVPQWGQRPDSPSLGCEPTTKNLQEK